MNTSSPKSILGALRNLGPYVLVELLLPGGTLVALLLWFAQQRRNGPKGENQPASA